MIDLSTDIAGAVRRNAFGSAIGQPPQRRWSSRDRQRGFMSCNPYSLGLAAPTDPDFSSVRLLCHGEFLVDSGPQARVLTAVGNAAITSAQFKFGANSMVFDGTADRVTTPDTTDIRLTTGNMTIECWVRFNATTGCRIFAKETGTGVAPYIIALSGTQKFQYAIYDNTSTLIGVVTSTTTAATGQWYFLQAVYNGTYTLYVNGTSEGTPITSAATRFSSASDLVTIGGDTAGGNTLNGWIDDLRLTAVARANAVPTAAFPDS